MQTDVLVVECTQFIGSNICNYLLQHTGLSVVGTDSMFIGHVENIQPSILSKSRFTYYPIDFYNDRISSHVIKLIKPKFVIIDATYLCDFHRISYILKTAADQGATKAVIIGRPTNQTLICNNHVGYNDVVNGNYDELVNRFKSNLFDFKNMSVIFLSPCELYGPRQPIVENFAALAIANLQKNALDISFGKADQPIQLCYIKDLFHNIVKYLSTDVNLNGYYELSTDTDCTYNDIYLFMNAIVNGHKYSLNITSNVSNNTKPHVLRAITHFDLEVSIEHTLCWYSDNKWAWR